MPDRGTIGAPPTVSFVKGAALAEAAGEAGLLAAGAALLATDGGFAAALDATGADVAGAAALGAPLDAPQAVNRLNTARAGMRLRRFMGAALSHVRRPFKPLG